MLYKNPAKKISIYIGKEWHKTMNYFGLFFSFMIPGIIIGIMIGLVLADKMREHKKPKAAKSKLFVYDMRLGK